MRHHLTAPLLLLALAACRPRQEAQPVAADSIVAAPLPAFALLSPKQGDTLVEGRGYVIRWRAPANFHLNLGAVMGGKDKGMLLTSRAAAPDSLVWNVPIGFVTGFGIASADNVRLRLENADSSEQWVEAGPFTITGASRE
jgi:hypothetical protein